MAQELQVKLADLNARFARGRPSNRLQEVGVVVHQIDALDEEHVGTNPVPWLACTATDADSTTPACAEERYSDHLSGSVINRKVPFIYSDDAVGFVVTPEHATVRCSFPEDGGTMSRSCSPDETLPDCLPGCYSGGRGCVAKTVAADSQNCYAHDALVAMMEQCEKRAMRTFDNNNGCRQGNGCRYNELVLEKAPWIAAQPHATQAIFYPAGGDAASARRVHQAFLKHYGVNARQVPLVKLNLDRPEAPFEPPSLSDGYLTQPAVCAALFRTDSKLHRMWGTKKAWQQSVRGEKRCWVYQSGGARGFFDRILKGSNCNLNWFEGAKGELGAPEARPGFSQAASPLLGFDEDLYDYCSKLIGQGKGSGDFNNELAHRCVEANQNILRILSSRPGFGWSMCQNFEWLMCAAKGLLPGQGERTMRFATAPKSLAMGEWQTPRTYPCTDGKSCDNRYSVGDVFFSEACILRRICHNGEEIFRLDKGKSFTCDLNEEGYRDLVRDLLRTALNIDTGVTDYYTRVR